MRVDGAVSFRGPPEHSSLSAAPAPKAEDDEALKAASSRIVASYYFGEPTQGEFLTQVFSFVGKARGVPAANRLLDEHSSGVQQEIPEAGLAEYPFESPLYVGSRPNPARGPASRLSEPSARGQNTYVHLLFAG